MDDVKLANYFAGLHRENVEVWSLDAKLAAAIAAPNGTPVWISDWTITKTGFRHSEIRFEQYRKLPIILQDGFVIRGHNNSILEVYYLDGWQKGRPGFFVSLKRTVKAEVYVTTFHAIHFKDVRRIYRRAERNKTMIRSLKSELALRLLAPRQ